MPTPTPADLELARLLARRRARIAHNRHLADDLEAEAMLAACEYDGEPGGLGRYVEDRLRKMLVRESSRELGCPVRDLADLDASPERRLTRTLQRRATRPRPLTPGQRRKARRNLVIAAAHRQGCSQRLLAEVFDLPRSLVGEIVKRFRDPQA